jgi:hypothetical protein
MDFLGMSFLQNVSTGLSFDKVNSAINNVFETYSGVIIAGILLTLSVYFIRKILNGANKGKARLR